MNYQDKFIAYIDILGFEKIVCERKIKLPDILKLLNGFLLEKEFNNKIYKPSTSLCPASEKKESHFELCATQISDSLIVSSEISIASAINLLFFCHRGVHILMRQGLMCRGYITRGEIYHSKEQVIGRGYIEAYQHESKKKTTFSVYDSDTPENGTPFVEINQESVYQYILNSKDKMAIEMMNRLVCVDKNGKIALFPIKQYIHSFAISCHTDTEQEKKEIDNIIDELDSFKSNLSKYVNENDTRAVEKLKHYSFMIDKQIEENNEAKVMIDKLNKSFGRNTI